jgi:hypothetical protein
MTKILKTVEEDIYNLMSYHILYKHLQFFDTGGQIS